MKSFATTKVQSGVYISASPLKVFASLSSLPSDNSEDSTRTWGLRQPGSPRAQPAGPVSSQQPPQLQSQGLQPSPLSPFQQILYLLPYLATDVPGPGIYQPQNDLSNEGKYVLSKNVSAGKRKFLDGRRLSFTEITARRSFSSSRFIQLPGQAATGRLLSSDSTT
jgi:hypothetical protein